MCVVIETCIKSPGVQLKWRWLISERRAGSFAFSFMGLEELDGPASVKHAQFNR
jgi:hypothetical protein